MPGVHIEQIRVDSINVFSNPSYYIVLLVSKDDADKTLHGPQPIASRRVAIFVRDLANLQSWDAIRLWVVVISETPEFLAVIDGFKQCSGAFEQARGGALGAGGGRVGFAGGGLF